MLMETIVATAGGVMVLCVALLWFLQRSAIRRKGQSRPLEAYPSVSVVRPIRGLDTEAEQNIAATLQTNYPGVVETLFVFDDADEPALPLVRQAIARHEARGGQHRSARIVFCGSPPEGVTGKLNAMGVGYREASGEILAFVDSDIRCAPHTLTVLVETLLCTPDTGAAFAPVVSTQPSKTVGDTAHTLLLNGMYGANAATLAWFLDGELPFIMGQFMVLRREAIEAMGGLEATHGQLVDDMYIGARLGQVGYRNRVSPVSVAVIQDGMSFRAFLKLYHKWMAFARAGLPQRSFKLVTYLQGVLFFSGIFGALLGYALGVPSAALVPLAAAGLVSAAITSLSRHLGGAPLPWRHGWVAFALILTAPLALLSTRVIKTVNWRGREYTIDASARMATDGAASQHLS